MRISTPLILNAVLPYCIPPIHGLSLEMIIGLPSNNRIKLPDFGIVFFSLHESISNSIGSIPM